MMPSSIRPSAPPIPAIVPMPESAIPALASADEALSPHADYNLHPLAVRSLEHYVILDEEEGERFHVR
ncbi:MAG: hypothetical protein ACYC0F_09700 [Rhodanobacter sp.]